MAAVAPLCPRTCPQCVSPPEPPLCGRAASIALGACQKNTRMMPGSCQPLARIGVACCARLLGIQTATQAAPLPQGAAYVDFRAAGYNDAWSDIFPDVPGFTCCQAQLDNNLVSELFT